MNKIPIGTIISFLLQITAAVFIYKGIFLAAQIIMVPAYFIVGQEVPKFTGWAQHILFCNAAIVLGQSLEYGSGHFPFLSLSLFLCAASILLRLVFYTTMVHTQLLWLDITVLLAAFIIYLFGNIFFHASWQGWVFPILPFAFSTMLVSSFIKEGLMYKKTHSEGYGVKINNPAPDFTLPDTQGNKITLSDFRSKRHVLLLFIRGDWCPACHMMMRTYEHSRAKFQEKNVFLLAVGPDPVGVNRNMAERIGLDFCIVSDDDQKVSTVYGVHVEEDPINNFLRPGYEEGLPLPASFLICDKGVVRYHSSPERVGEFLNPDFIFDVLKRI